MKNKALVLDLDDTLYEELDFLKSGYLYISKKLSIDNSEVLYEELLKEYFLGGNAFEIILERYPKLSKEVLLQWYREHKPELRLFDGVTETLEMFGGKYKFAIITDGRSITQRNKILALGLNSYLDALVISEEIGSEKPSERNFLKVEESLQCSQYIYVGDNVRKDFITPNRLGWTTICLRDRGRNIHKQNFDVNKDYLPQFIATDWKEIRQILLMLEN